MGELNREEVDAKIETAETRFTAVVRESETRLTAVVREATARMDSTVARIEAKSDAADRRMDEFKQQIQAATARLEKTADRIAADNRDTRKIVVITGITGVLTVIFGVAAVNSALLTHFQGGVEAGTRVAAEHEAIRRDLHALAVSVSEIKQRLPEPPRK